MLGIDIYRLNCYIGCTQGERRCIRFTLSTLVIAFGLDQIVLRRLHKLRRPDSNVPFTVPVTKPSIGLLSAAFELSKMHRHDPGIDFGPLHDSMYDPCMDIRGWVYDEWHVDPAFELENNGCLVNVWVDDDNGITRLLIGVAWARQPARSHKWHWRCKSKEGNYGS